MARITEQEVMLAFNGLAENQASTHGAGLSREDADAIARIALLFAIRTYRPGQTQCFTEYAREIIRELLTREKRRERTSRRVESRLSLDMRISYDDDSSTYADLYAVFIPDDTEYDVKEFIQELPRHEKIPLVRVMSGCEKKLDKHTRINLQRKAVNYGFVV